MVPSSITALLLSASTLVTAAPALTPHTVAKLQHRGANCTFTDAAAASKSKSTCSTIVLSNITVPAGTTLDMTKLRNGTTV
jgi:polygalacturonase